MTTHAITRTPRPVTRRNSSTSTSWARTPIPPDVKLIPLEQQHILEAPCDLCSEVRPVRFVDGLCASCLRCQVAAAQADREQDRLAKAVAMLATADEAASRGR